MGNRPTSHLKGMFSVCCVAGRSAMIRGTYAARLASGPTRATFAGTSVFGLCWCPPAFSLNSENSDLWGSGDLYSGEGGVPPSPKLNPRGARSPVAAAAGEEIKSPYLVLSSLHSVMIPHRIASNTAGIALRTPSLPQTSGYCTRFPGHT